MDEKFLQGRLRWLMFTNQFALNHGLCLEKKSTFLPLIGISSTKKGAATSEKKRNLPPWPSRPLPLRSPDCPPHEVTHAEVNITQAAPSSPMRTNKTLVANLFGVSQGVTQNKISLIPREKTGHTPVRKKHGDATQRASSVRARIAIQEALSAEMSTLQVDDSLSGRIELLDHCQTMIIITPDSDDNDDQHIDDSADDEDYDPAPIANPDAKRIIWME